MLKPPAPYPQSSGGPGRGEIKLRGSRTLGMSPAMVLGA